MEANTVTVCVHHFLYAMCGQVVQTADLAWPLLRNQLILYAVFHPGFVVPPCQRAHAVGPSSVIPDITVVVTGVLTSSEIMTRAPPTDGTPASSFHVGIDCALINDLEVLQKQL